MPHTTTQTRLRAPNQNGFGAMKEICVMHETFRVKKQVYGPPKSLFGHLVVLVADLVELPGAVAGLVLGPGDPLALLARPLGRVAAPPHAAQLLLDDQLLPAGLHLLRSPDDLKMGEI